MGYREEVRALLTQIKSVVGRAKDFAVLDADGGTKHFRTLEEDDEEEFGELYPE